jgi:ring-1,2-phenylacetyl-CoA epoxidase subunit PaaC
MKPLVQYTLRLADNVLILGHRLSEWCGHGPVLEQDIAMTNIALDLVGQARSLYAYAATTQGEGKTEDDLAYLRDVGDYTNILLVEQPNGDFGYTIARQFFFSAFQLPFYQQLAQCSDEVLAGVAQKGIKELAYHLRWSSEWVIRLGDGTEESHRRMQQAIDDLWMYSGEFFIADELDQWAATTLGIDLNAIQTTFQHTLDQVFSTATIDRPTAIFMQKGGKKGLHSEHLGFILAEMQFLQRAYPGAEW